MFTFKSFTSNICVYGQYRAYVAVRRMSNSTVNVKIRAGLSTSDPEQTPVLIVGQVPHLNSLTWQDVRCKLEPRVTEALWQRGLGLVSTPSGDSCELWPRGASLASLPARRSRHSPPARPHALAKIVRNAPPSRQTLEYIVLVCRKQDVLASVVSIARSFPLFNARSNGGPLVANSEVAPKSRTVTVEVLLVDDKSNGDGWEPEPAVDPVLLETTLDPEELSTLQDAADYVRLAARITDTPANIMDVDKFIEEATCLAKSLDIEAPTVIRGEALLARGMGGIYGVGRAAACPPALVSLSYCPPDASEGVAWVGKGIVYDTGGLSIKTRTAMVGMKGDCAGAAGVLAAFALAARARPRCRLHAVLCLAENAVGPHATRPDDIHTLYSGRTVEINNTDAEGRLVLSDGVVYASRDLKADTIIDVATLTGAQGTATGKYHAAIISNTSWLESACVAAGLVSGDATHALPFAPELHYAEFSSGVADMKNSVQDRGNAPVSCAGLFMLAQLGFDFRGAWLHVDMASPSSCGERATGYGVALLPVLLGAHTQNRLLRALAPAPIVRPR